jgi:hypothetical protein
MPDAENPLTEEDLQSINDALEQSQVAERGIAKAVRAGIPMDGMLEDIREKRQRLQQIKNTYFPGVG